MNQKRWYHATTKDNWKKIRESGGLRKDSYLSPTKEDIDILWQCEVLLSVRYILDERDWNGGFEVVARRIIPFSDLKVAEYL